MEQLLSIENLKIYFHMLIGTVRAVDGVSFSINRGETLGVVGESGCGKSVTAMSLLQLIPMPPGELVEGRAIFEGKDLLQLSAQNIRKVCGNRISMIFQEPMTSLNPVFTIGSQMCESIQLHQGAEKNEAKEKAVEMLKLVGIPESWRRIKEYPHQLSGGMRQRVMIAMALSCNPALLIADEPTTALDVTIQAQILELMADLQKRTNMSIMMITHDLGVIAETADRVVVMYCGKIVESADVRSLFQNPLHPYTRQLMTSIPRLDAEPGRLQEIPGAVPTLYNPPAGCAFHPRCSVARNSCRRHSPRLVEIRPGHLVACDRVEET
ncbi:MAG: ABC transporter ATP-binding protein [Spirochaetales bacterium]|jgi:peptide/nickel transport system ATP-binding protein|nr:ABC transporter ATP-binding protein [Spirochaetales bacterium]